VTKYKLLLLLPVLIFATFFYFSRQQLTPSTVSLPSYHPLSINALRSRQYSSEPLKKLSSTVIQYSSDGLAQRALMLTPSGSPPAGGWPVVIVNHGHIPEFEYSTERSYINTSRYFASQGFLVLKPDYRGHDLSAGYASGRLLARSEFAVDVLNLLSTLKSIPNVNQNRIFMYGHSMGGEISLMVMESVPFIRAATLWAPSTTTFPEIVLHFVQNRSSTKKDLETFTTQYSEFVNQYPIAQISAIENLDYINTPIIIHHSTTDESVPYEWGVTLFDKLKALNKSVSFYEYVGDNHDISGHWSQALSRDVEFFNSFK